MNQKMLPPSPSGVTVQTGLSMASEGLTIAIGKLLEDRTDNSRFSEVSALAKMGQDLQRHVAKAERTVRAYSGTVPVCTTEDVEAYDNPQLDEILRRAQRADRDPAWIGAPYNVGDNELGGGLGPLQGIFNTLSQQMRAQAESRDREAEQNRKESDVRQLEALLMAKKHAGPGPTSDLLESRITQLTARIARLASEEATPPAEEILYAPPPPGGKPRSAPPPPALPICCTECGARQRAYWVNKRGDPLDCPICDGRTIFKGPRDASSPDFPNSTPHAPTEGATIDAAQTGDSQ